MYDLFLVIENLVFSDKRQITGAAVKRAGKSYPHKYEKDYIADSGHNPPENWAIATSVKNRYEMLSTSA